MRRLLIFVVFLTLLSSVHLPQAFATREMTVSKIENTSVSRINLGGSSIDQCNVGNTNSPYWAVSNFLLPPEEYKLAFKPTSGECSDCTPGFGFAINTIHIMMQTTETCTLTMSMDVENALWPLEPGCLEPGPFLCESLVYSVVLPNAGLWDISLPITCACLPLNHWYFLSVTIHDSYCATGTRPDLITDVGPPTYCTNLNNWDDGWYDLLAQYPDWPGNLIIYANAACCTPPIISTDENTWGAIKKMFLK